MMNYINKAIGTLLLTALTLSCSQTGTTTHIIDTQSDKVADTSVDKAAAEFTATSIENKSDSSKYVPGEIIVKFKSDPDVTSNDKLEKFDLKKVRVLADKIYLTKANGNDIYAEIEKLKKNSDVLYAEPNYIISLPPQSAGPAPAVSDNSIMSYPNDPMFASQYAHRNCATVQGWSFTLGNPNIIVAVVDTGVDLNHPDLRGKLVVGYDFVDNDNNPMDAQGHGTHCAGIVGAITNNGVGVAGFAPNCKIMPVRVLDNAGNGNMANIVSGINYASTHGARVISLSLGGTAYSQALADSVKMAFNYNAVVVAAMGNSGKREQYYPAALPGVIGVGATDAGNQHASFSTYGNWMSVAAPGNAILSTLPTYANGTGRTNYGTLNGTSMSCPAVAGLAALVRSKYPNFTPNDVKTKIERSSGDIGAGGYDEYFGYGLINVYNTLR